MTRNLFIVDGAAGTGKSDLVEYVCDKHSRGGRDAIVTKLTTRERRPEEKTRRTPLDLTFVKRTAFQKHRNQGGFYCYKYGGAWYGFHKSAVDRALSRCENVFVIVRDLITIRQLVADYPAVRCIPVLVYSDYDQVVKRLRLEAYKDSAIRFRISRLELVYDDYLKHPEVYREIIINNSNKNDFRRLIDILLAKYSPDHDPADMLVISNQEYFPLLKSLVGHKRAILGHLGSYERNVFLMMKYRTKNAPLARLIREVLAAHGFNCVKANDRGWDITRDVYNPLAVLYCCKCGIALFDEAEKGNNFSPNVAYELAMMQLQRKNCLILRDKRLPCMPFDLIKDLNSEYSSVHELKGLVADWAQSLEDKQTGEPSKASRVLKTTSE